MQPKDIDGASHPKAFFGSELRRLREVAGLTQAELGQLVYISGSYIGQMEVGARWPSKRDQAEAFDKVLHADGHLLRVWELANRSPDYPDYFADQAKNEQTAARIELYCATVMHGLLQTPDYARALLSASGQFWAPEEIEGRTKARIDRAEILGTAPAAPRVDLWCVLSEAAIRAVVGGPKVMHGQLTHLMALVTKRRLTLQVLPFTTAAHPLVMGSVALMEFPDLPPVAFVEDPQNGQALTDTDAVQRLARSYDFVRATALSPAASFTFIETVSKEYGR